MLKQWKNKTSVPVLCMIFLCGPLATTLPATANADSHRGPAFTDPEHKETMPGSWLDKSIQYEKLPANTDLAITLDQHLYPALLPLINRYAKQHKLQVAVQEGTCGISAGALLDKKVDIGGFCCPPGKTDRLPGLRYHTLGIAALALIVEQDNPVDNISLQQAQDIFQGKLGDWQEVTGNASQPINTVARLHCKNRPGHWRLILDNEDQFSAATREVSTIPDMIGATAGTKNAIGYETLWMTQQFSSQGQVKAMKIDGISPYDNKALSAGKYPFYRTYNITTWTDETLRKPHAEQLLAYIYQHFNEVETRYGLVPSTSLREAGWKFSNDELVAAPGP